MERHTLVLGWPSSTEWEPCVLLLGARTPIAGAWLHSQWQRAAGDSRATGWLRSRAAHIPPSSGEGADRPASLGWSYPLRAIPSSADTEEFRQTVCIVRLIYYNCAMHSHLPSGDLAQLAPAHRYEHYVSYDLLPHSYKLISADKKIKRGQPYVLLDPEDRTFYSLIWHFEKLRSALSHSTWLLNDYDCKQVTIAVNWRTQVKKSDDLGRSQQKLRTTCTTKFLSGFLENGYG